MSKNKKVFATLFTDMWNIQLIKDPGMIPLTFNNVYGFNSIIPIFAGRDYPFRDIYFKNIEMPVLYGDKNQFIRDIARTKWLIKNAKKVDILNLFFFYRGTWFFMWLYKKLNPDGLLYIHADSDGKRLLNFHYSKNPIKKYLIQKIFLKDSVINDTFWGIQNSEYAKKMQGQWPFFKVDYIPNGVYWENEVKTSYDIKENIILTVARLGSPEKNTDMLVKAFAAISPNFPDWKLKLVGPIEKNFEKYIDNIYTNNPELKEKIVFTGPIYNRQKLEKEYASAKVFCLPSSWESFGIVAIEAMSKGCYILGSDIASNAEITQNEKMGKLFKNGDKNDLINKMNDCLSNEKIFKDNFDIAVAFAHDHYSWEKALEPVVKWTKEKWVE